MWLNIERTDRCIIISGFSASEVNNEASQLLSEGWSIVGFSTNYNTTQEETEYNVMMQWG